MYCIPIKNQRWQEIWVVLASTMTLIIRVLTWSWGVGPLSISGDLSRHHLHSLHVPWQMVCRCLFLWKFGKRFVAWVGQVKIVVLPNLGAQISSGDHETKQNFDRFYPTSTLPLSFSTFQWPSHFFHSCGGSHGETLESEVCLIRSQNLANAREDAIYFPDGVAKLNVLFY